MSREFTVEITMILEADSELDAVDDARALARHGDPVCAVSNEHGMTKWLSLYGNNDAIMLMEAEWYPSSEMMANLAEWMLANDWAPSEIVEMLRKPNKYAAEYTAMITERAYDEVAKEPEQLEEDDLHATL